MYVDPGRPGTVLVKTTFAKKSVLTIAKQTFLQAELCQILARKFSKIRVSCGFRSHFFGACWQAMFPFFSEQALQRWNVFCCRRVNMQIHIPPLPALHIEEKICALWEQRVGDEVFDSTPCGIDGFSIATDFLRSTVDSFVKLTAFVSYPLMQNLRFSGHFWVTFGAISQQHGSFPVCHGFQMFKWAKLFGPRIRFRRLLTFLLSLHHSDVPDQHRPSSLQGVRNPEEWHRISKRHVGPACQGWVTQGTVCSNQAQLSRCVSSQLQVPWMILTILISRCRFYVSIWNALLAPKSRLDGSVPF